MFKPLKRKKFRKNFHRKIRDAKRKARRKTTEFVNSLEVVDRKETVKTNNQLYLRGHTIFRFMSLTSQTGKVRQG